jgi:hypothetical protein
MPSRHHARHTFHHSVSVLFALFVVALSGLLSSASAAPEETVTGATTAGDLVIVDWQRTSAGDVVATGRTLITLENGAVAEVVVLDRSEIAPASAGENQPTADAGTGYYAIVDEQGNTVVPEQPAIAGEVAAAGAEARGWPNFDPTSMSA